LRFEPDPCAGAARFVRDQGHPVRAAGPSGPACETRAAWPGAWPRRCDPTYG
jgi:hypothetical protein